MSLSDRSLPRPLSAGDLAALQALREDRDACGPGVARNVLGAAGCTLYPDSLLARLRAHGYVIGVKVDGLDRRYQLGHSEPAVSSASASSPPPAAIPLSSADTLLTVEPKATSHYESEAA